MTEKIKEEQLFHFTEDQQEIVAKHFGKDMKNLEFWEACELLDRLIDENVD